MAPRIVVGIDGSDHARRALRFAVDEARVRGATLDAVFAYRSVAYYPGLELGIVTVPSKDELEAAAHETLRRALDRIPGDVEVERIVADGSPVDVLLEVAEGADLLVVGSRGLGGFRGLLLGSTSHQLASHAPCPVVVVPPTDDPDADDG